MQCRAAKRTCQVHRAHLDMTAHSAICSSQQPADPHAICRCTRFLLLGATEVNEAAAVLVGLPWLAAAVDIVCRASIGPSVLSGIMEGCSCAVRRLTIPSALCVRRVITSVEQKGCTAREAGRRCRCRIRFDRPQSSRALQAPAGLKIDHRGNLQVSADT